MVLQSYSKIDTKYVDYIDKNVDWLERNHTHMADLKINRTRNSKAQNLAIISHPDAGKTTLTEKLLLYGGAH